MWDTQIQIIRSNNWIKTYCNLLSHLKQTLRIEQRSTKTFTWSVQDIPPNRPSLVWTHAVFWCSRWLWRPDSGVFWWHSVCRPPADFCCAGPCTGRAPCLWAMSKTPSILSCQVELKQPISSYRLQTLLTIVTNTVHMSWVIFASLDFILLVENENSICPFFIHSVMAIFNQSELFNKCNWAKITSYIEDYIQLWMLCSISVLNLWFVCVICKQ